MEVPTIIPTSTAPLPVVLPQPFTAPPIPPANNHNTSILWTPYLRIEELPVGMDWEEFYIASGLPALFNGSIKALRLLQSVEDGSCTIWLQMASEMDALQTQGFLGGRAYNNDSVPDCTLVLEERFKSACLMAVHMKILDPSAVRNRAAKPLVVQHSASPA
jgi:hypothetical protein